MAVPSLQEISLVRLSVMFWTKTGMEEHFIKQKNGVANVEYGLARFKDSILSLVLPVNVRKRFVSIWERVGYEIFLFVTKSGLNSPEAGFQLRDIQWYVDGLIDEKSTFVRHFGKNPNDFLYFQCLCVICAEEELRQLWPKVRSETQRIKRINLLVSYWTFHFQNDSDDFIAKNNHYIIGFKRDKSIQYNMALHCLNFNFKMAVTYFLKKLTSSELLLLADEDLSHFSLLKKILSNPSREHMKFICGFLEKPLMDASLLDLIAKRMPDVGVLELINHLLRQVNCFGNLHYDLLMRLFASPLNVCVKDFVKSNLDFYVLNLLSKGHFQSFEFLFEDFESILKYQIYNRLANERGLGLFYKIKKNNQSRLLYAMVARLTNVDPEVLSMLNSVLGDS